MTTPRDQFIEAIVRAYFEHLAGTEYDVDFDDALEQALELIRDQVESDVQPWRPMSYTSANGTRFGIRGIRPHEK